MKKLIRLKESRTARLARLAASTVAVEAASRAKIGRAHV